MKVIIDNYSKAFLDLCAEKKEIEPVLKAVNEFLLQMNEKENRVFYTLPPKLQKEIIDNLKLPEIFRLIMIDIFASGKSSILEEILVDFTSKCQEYLGKVKIELITSKEESADFAKNIGEIFSQHIQKAVLVETKIDPDIIGGFIINYKNWEYNFSVSNFLEKMREEF